MANVKEMSKEWKEAYEKAANDTEVKYSARVETTLFDKSTAGEALPLGGFSNWDEYNDYN